MTDSLFDAVGDPLTAIADLSDAFARDAGRLAPDAAVANPIWEDVARMVDHLGGIYRWVAATVRSGECAERGAHQKPDPAELEPWFRESRSLLLDALTSTASTRACWTLYDKPGTAGFWRRRMLHETTMHLGDLRTADGTGYAPPAEASAAVFADGIAEHLGVFLDRSRPNLDRLPAPFALHATDAGVRWTILEDWQVAQNDGASSLRPGTTTVAGPAGWLAAFAWDRVTLADTPALSLSGDAAVAAAYTAAPVHP
ncbi:MAG: hypothetical protein CMF56_01400 [Leifsonia sp.]|nr:hypothetical protein [Leifsonia sp.]